MGFVLGAGLGKRLGTLTESIPKPLIPIFNRPLITYTFDRLRDLGIHEIIVNTHHCAEVYHQYFCPDVEGIAQYKAGRITFRHEPVLLETAGGIRNSSDLLQGQSFLVYNGDILSNLPIQPAIDRHFREGNLATLILRSQGDPLRVQLNEETGLISDIGGRIGGYTDRPYLFTGIYLLSPEIHQWIPKGQPLSMTPLLVERIRQGDRIAGVVIDEGDWWDIGTRDAYLKVHQKLFSQADDISSFPAGPTVHPSARVDSTAKLQGFYAIGAHCKVGAGSVIEDSVIWDGACIGKNVHLQRCIVRSDKTVASSAKDRDF